MTRQGPESEKERVPGGSSNEQPLDPAADPWADLSLPRVKSPDGEAEPPPAAVETTRVREVVLQYRGRALRAPDVIREPAAAVDLARRIVRDDAREHFLAVYLDGRHRPIGHSVVSIGTATASLVHPREVFQSAVLLGAVSVLLLHNHPSGDPSPSREDREVTDRLRDAGRILGIRLLDHIVWTRHGSYHSFRESSLSEFERG